MPMIRQILFPNCRYLQQIISQTEIDYDDAVAETARVTENRPELDKQKQWIINERLAYIADHINEHPEVCIQYFGPDKRKIGGKIIEICGNVIKISEADATLILSDCSIIKFANIVRLSIREDS